MQKIDDSQAKFIEAPPGNIRLLAPAGCGKTLSLLHRCNHLRNLNPSARHLLITFTVAARDEIKSRMSDSVDFRGLQETVEVTTLNAWGFRRMKQIASSPKLLTGRDDFHFTVSNQLRPIWLNHEAVKRAIESKSNVVPKQIMGLIDTFKSIGFDHERDTNRDSYCSRADSLRNLGLGRKLDEISEELVKVGVASATPARGQRVRSITDREVYDLFFRFWREACGSLHKSNVFTLEDQKYFAYLDERQKLKDGKYLSGAARYSHVLVDEFQDINPLDLSLIRTISDRSRASLTLVGDDDQAIYEWRGASPQFILKPETYFNREFEKFSLQVNYRSPQNIVRMSQQLISRNQNRVEKNVTPSLSIDARISVCRVPNLEASIEQTMQQIQDHLDKDESTGRIAIVGRKRNQLIPYQILFASKGLSFCAAEDLHVFLSTAFDRLIHLLTLHVDAARQKPSTQSINDLLELCSLVKRYPLKKSDKESLRKFLASTAPKSLKDACDNLRAYDGPLKGPNQNRQISTNMASSIQSLLDSKNVADALRNIGSQFEGLQLDLGKAEDDIFYIDPPFAHLAEYASKYSDDFVRFIEDVERAKEHLVSIPPHDEPADPEAEIRWKRPIHLMTALRAKGKEFEHVILLDVVDGIWPSKNAKDPDQREAERRVFYVAFTRAKESLTMIIPEQVGPRSVTISPFVGELGYLDA